MESETQSCTLVENEVKGSVFFHNDARLSGVRCDLVFYGHGAV